MEEEIKSEDIFNYLMSLKDGLKISDIFDTVSSNAGSYHRDDSM